MWNKETKGEITMKQKCIYITDEDIANKTAIEQSLDGAKLSYSAIYRHGLISLKHLEKRISISLDNVERNNQTS